MRSCRHIHGTPLLLGLVLTHLASACSGSDASVEGARESPTNGEPAAASPREPVPSEASMPAAGGVPDAAPPATTPLPVPGNQPNAPSSGPEGPQAPAPSECTQSAELGSPLRRLTLTEYENTVRDLLGIEAVPTQSFPADSMAGGFDNNASLLGVSPLLAERYLEAAESLAATAASTLTSLLPCDAAAIGEEACALQFVQSFGGRAYRRPLTDSEQERLLRAYAAGREEASFESGIELVIQTVLQAPAFLYRLEVGTDPSARQGLVHLTQHELASRLSYFLWGSMPSDALLAAADGGALAGPDDVAAWAREMLQDARARRAVSEFHRQWLGVTPLAGINKDSTLHPEFDEVMRGAMAAELPAFVEHVLWTGDRRLHTLLTAPLGFVSGPLAELYGVPMAPGAGPSLAMLDPAERSGVLTQAAVLAVHSLPSQSSPVARGKFVRERLLCQHPPPPPADLDITPPEVDASLSTRERFAQHTESAACSVCHELMDPLGFAFESYDAVGRFRSSEAGQPIDTSGYVAQSEDADGPFQNVRELSERLAESEQVRGCLANQWFRYAFGRFDGPADVCSLAEAEQAFAASGGDVLELLVALTQTESFLYRRALRAEEVLP